MPTRKRQNGPASEVVARETHEETSTVRLASRPDTDSSIICHLVCANERSGGLDGFSEKQRRVSCKKFRLFIFCYMRLSLVCLSLYTLLIGVQQLILVPLQSGTGDVTLAADAAPFFLFQPMRSIPLEKEDLCLWSSIDCV